MARLVVKEQGVLNLGYKETFDLHPFSLIPVHSRSPATTQLGFQQL